MARLRQAVIAARDLEGEVTRLRALLPSLGESYADPNVAVFGLRNAVMALGDTFVEVVSPVQEGTAAGRFLERSGDGPYMAIFQVDDLPAARARARAAGVREAWSVELEDISAVHLHPKALGAILSLDEPRPPESWRWAGPEWTGGAPAHAGGEHLAGLTLCADDAAAARWRAIVGDAVDVERAQTPRIGAFHTVSGLRFPA